MQAHDAGHKDEQRRLEGGGYGQRPGGRRFTPSEEVDSGCKHEDGNEDERILMEGW